MQIIRTVPLHTSRHLNFNQTCYLNKEANPREWFWAERPNGARAVIVVAIVDYTATEGIKLVVTQEFRVPVNDYVWDLPAGMIDPNEDAREAAVRELKEETGLDVVSIERVTPFVFSSPGMTDEANCIVYVRAKGIPSDSGTESSEDIKVHLMSQNDVTDLLLDVYPKKYKIGAKAYLVLDMFARFGFV